MELRILGVNNYESRDTRMAGYVVDDVLALDAGSLTRSLTFAEQKRLQAIILSHRHFDHTRDLIPLALYARNERITLDVYGIQDTIQYLQTSLLSPRYVLDFTNIPSPDAPALRYHTVAPGTEFRVLDYAAVAVSVPHAVPAAGFQVSDGSTKLFYTGDTGVGVRHAWKHVAPDVVLTEVTFGNENEEQAHEVGHLTPRLLGQALGDFKDELGYLPIVIASHMKPDWEATVREELKETSRELGIEIIVAEPDLTLTL